MDYDDFMSECVKVKGLGLPELSKEQLASMSAKFRDVPAEGKEQKMYAPLCKSLNEALEQAEKFAAAQVTSDATAQTIELAIPSDPATQTIQSVPSKPCYVFKDVSNWIESNEEDLKIDIAMYPDTEDARTAFNRDMKNTARTDPARVAWAWMTMGVEVKRDEALSAFDFGRPSLLRDSDMGRVAQAQIAKYATQLMVRQHRVFVFILYIVDKEAFLTRWDRVGCIISNPVNYIKEPAKILNFVYRLALMSRDELGYDTTAEPATSAEVQMLKGYAQKFKNPYAASCATEILDNQVLYPIYKVTCANVANTDRGVYFIGKHSVASYSPTGRATKGYVTFIEQPPARLCFMKDYWRPNSSKIPKELDVYKKLKTAKVRFVATAIGGEDVPGQSTVTQIYLPPGEVPLERLHCRLVVEELARPLEAYRSSAEMIVVLFHALQGHKDAWTKAEILHRDVSVDNVLRVVDQKDEKDRNVQGILNDWDLCKYKSDMNQKATPHGRSGTWAFMSAIVLCYPLKPNDLADDLESFIHVVTYCSLRFHRHDFTNHDVGTTPKLTTSVLIDRNRENEELFGYVDDHFHESRHRGGGIYVGGTHKMEKNLNGRPGFDFTEGHVSPILVDLLKNLFRLLRTHYSAIDFDDLKRYRGRLPPPAPPPSQDVEEQPDVPSAHQPHHNRFANLLKPDDEGDEEFPDNKDNKEFPDNNPAPSGSRVLDTHSTILHVFWKAVQKIASRKEQFDITQDQFIGLDEQGATLLKGLSGSKRKSASSSTPEGNLKRKRAIGSSHLGGVAEGTERDDVVE
ncbi:hypothetical protein BC835DRAFT_1414894 [Cytidiella melzeri]|nr:hypothetical protein BC835DRAFT_1414894 [Cytidiella melzeri]